MPVYEQVNLVETDLVQVKTIEATGHLRDLRKRDDIFHDVEVIESGLRL